MLGKKEYWLFLIRRRAISQLLVVAALFTAMGTDALAQAGVAVRADAVVSVAERMASKFSHAFAREVHHPAMRFQVTRPVVALNQRSPAANWMPVRRVRQAERLLYLPPPVLT